MMGNIQAIEVALPTWASADSILRKHRAVTVNTLVALYEQTDHPET